jgi:predicted permease
LPNEDLRFVFGIIALMPGVMASVSMAEVYGGDIPFVSAMVLNTHVACIVTVPIGLWILGVC